MKHLQKKYLLLFANKLIEKIPDPLNATEHYQSFIRKKNNQKQLLINQKLLKTQILLI